jgi:Cyclic nucleotide-binding domain
VERVVAHHTSLEDGLQRLSDDPDPWIRDCAGMVLAGGRGEPMADALTTLSDLERVLFLRRVPPFTDLSPRDLRRVAAIAGEQTYVDGELIAGQGEAGGDLHIVVGGEVAVVREEAATGAQTELARRVAGDVVGEMALITGEPRMASLVAVGNAPCGSAARGLKGYSANDPTPRSR